MSEELQIHATYTESRVNCGDHAQDIQRAIAITPDMTIEEVLAAGLAYRLNGELHVSDEDYITIRVAKVGAHSAPQGGPW